MLRGSRGMEAEGLECRQRTVSVVAGDGLRGPTDAP